MDLRSVTNTGMLSPLFRLSPLLILVNRSICAIISRANFFKELILQDIIGAVDTDLLKPMRNTRAKAGRHALEAVNVKSGVW